MLIRKEVVDFVMGNILLGGEAPRDSARGIFTSSAEPAEAGHVAREQAMRLKISTPAVVYSLERGS